MKTSIVRRLACAALLAGVAGAHAEPAGYPDRPVRIVVPYTPGGATDTVARSIASQLSTRWGQPVIVENRAGASGMIGAAAVAKAQPDGYTLVLADSAPFVILPSLHADMAYDPLKDFASITVVARQVPILVVSSKLPVHSVKELVAYLKAHPNTPYGSLGPGSYPHVAMEAFQQLSGTRMLHVPYKGTAQVTTDMIGGQVSLYIGTLGAFQQQEKAGTVRILAVATQQRVSLRPDLPTVAEAGVPGFAVNVWFGLAGRAGTPAGILDKIHADVQAVLRDRHFVEEVLLPQELTPGGDSRADFGDLMRSDTERWRQSIQSAGIKL